MGSRWSYHMRLQTIAAVAVVAATATYLAVGRSTPVALPVDGRPAAVEFDGGPPADAATIVVHVSGCVVSPGIVELEAPARVAAAVAGAGGALRCADLSGVNLAAELQDGQQLVVPAFGAVSSSPGTADDVDDGRIHLNTATAAQLESLPGIGPVLAGRIVEHREKSGPFVEVEDLLDVAGIGEAKLVEIRSLVDL
jgi:competence protein ComEA